MQNLPLRDRIQNSKLSQTIGRDLLLLGMVLLAFHVNQKLLVSRSLWWPRHFQAFLYFMIIAGVSLLIAGQKVTRGFTKATLPKRSKLYRGGLILILVLFTAIKMPFFKNSFTGSNLMKYNTYVEPAVHMVDHNNPFFFQQKYRANPFTNREGIFGFPGHLPLMEWSLAAIFKWLPSLSAEIATRLLTHSIGVLTLLSAYWLFSQWLTRKEALLITFLLSINQIFSFATHVTVYDSWIILLMFLSLGFLSRYFTTDRLLYLILAGLLFGLGNTLKYSLFLFLAPIGLASTFLSRRNFVRASADSIFYFTYSLLPVMTFMSVRRWPLLFPTVTVWALIYTTLFISQLQLKKLLEIFLLRVKQRPAWIIVGALIFLIAAILFLKFTHLQNYSQNFLTDSQLVLNLQLYTTLLQKAQGYLTPSVYQAGLIGLGLIILNRPHKLLVLTLSFLVGTLTYYILASKVIFFHNYYHLIAMVTFSILAAYTISFLSSLLANRATTTLLTASMILLLAPQSVRATRELLSRELEGFQEAATYLVANTQPDNFYIDEGNLQTLTITTGRPSFQRHEFLETEEFKQIVRQQGFGTAMERFGIKYLVTKQKAPHYTRYISMFTNNVPPTKSCTRTEMILASFDGVLCYDDEDLRKRYVEKLHLQDKFKLEAEIGDYRFYSFRN